MQLIDLQLLITHMIGFLIVLWLLRRFAWGPILGFLKARADAIAGDIDAAKAERQRAGELRAQYQTQTENIEREVRQAEAQIRARQRELRARTEEEQAEIRRMRTARTEEELRRMRDSARETLRKQTVELALLAAERAIRERMNDAKHQELVTQFIDELEAGRETSGGA
ncbi:MAG: F0F1 ATP synthase subunit B [Candidatus Eisenbacteria bacterium]|nr:F0F1 ATP synthase subunit B [Candidatus Eisenbacteria bacterium]